MIFWGSLPALPQVPKEARAWTINELDRTPGRGVIHTDFERGFIKSRYHCFPMIMWPLRVSRAPRMQVNCAKEGKGVHREDGDVLLFPIQCLDGCR